MSAFVSRVGLGRLVAALVLALLQAGAGIVYAGRPVLGIAFLVASRAALFGLVALGFSLGLSPRAFVVLFLALGLALFVANLWLTARTLAEGWPRSGRRTALALGLVVAGFIASFFVSVDQRVRSFRIAADTMAPGLVAGDRILADMRAPLALERGDVVVLVAPPAAAIEAELWVKRVIGLPGDEVEVDGPRVVVNGETLASLAACDEAARAVLESPGMPEGLACVLERWTSGRAYPIALSARQGPPATRFSVPAGHVFVLGDNRGYSLDSRAFGFVPRENVLGRGMGVYWHRRIGP